MHASSPSARANEATSTRFGSAWRPPRSSFLVARRVTKPETITTGLQAGTRRPVLREDLRGRLPTVNACAAIQSHEAPRVSATKLARRITQAIVRPRTAGTLLSATRSATWVLQWGCRAARPSADTRCANSERVLVLSFEAYVVVGSGRD